MPKLMLVGRPGWHPLNWTVQLLKEIPGALILHWAKCPQTLWAVLLLSWGRDASAGVKQSACFLHAVPTVGRVQPGLRVAG